MAMMTATSMVATRMNATGKGPYFAPSHRDRNTPTTNWANTATSGDFHRGCTWAKALGKTRRIRAIAYHVRVVALEAAFELAMAELALPALAISQIASAVNTPISNSPISVPVRALIWMPKYPRTKTTMAAASADTHHHWL